MLLNGYPRPAELWTGGITEVWLAGAAEVESCTYDLTSGCYTAAVLKNGASFARYDLMEDTSGYRQYTTGFPPLMKVVHEIYFRLPPGEGWYEAFAGLLAAGRNGFVALIRNGAGESLIAGWSPEFDEECPLYIHTAAADTLSSYYDDPEGAITLRSEDVSFSHPFTGALPR